MRRLLLIICVILPMVCMAQNRVLKGVVFGANEASLSGVTISVENSAETTVSVDGGQFEINVSPYARYLVATAEGYLPARLEIDGSFMVFRLKVDKKYLENKLKAEEAARLAAEKEAQAQAKAEEDARLAAEKEAQAKAKAEENARLAAEKEAQAKVKAEARAEVLANTPTAEEKRMAKEAKRAEYIAAMEAELAELDRVKAEKMAAREAVRKRDALSSEVMNNTTKKNDDLYQSIGLGVQVSNADEDYSSLGFKYILGHKSEKIILGAGVGLSVCYGSKGGIRGIDTDEWDFLTPAPAYMPLFVYLKRNANVDDDVCPFVALAAGANVSLPFKVTVEMYYDGGVAGFNHTLSYLFVNPHVGLNFKTNNNKDMSVSFGAQFVNYPYYDINCDSIKRDSISFCMDFQLSYIF
ncbi:MAG: hypothetical protein IKY51_03085 [Alistipes sp.]|nr:hypothetical protein [Alistipes sp.]